MRWLVPLLLGLLSACGGSSGADPEPGIAGDAIPDLSKIPVSGFGAPIMPQPFEPGVSDPQLYEAPVIEDPIPVDLERACPGTEPPTFCDGDGDGRGGDCDLDNDCDDADPTIYPGAPELPGDGIDQDCDGTDLAFDDDAGVFVVSGALDTAAGTRADPVGTVSRGVELAEATARPAVFIGGGYYPEQITSTVSLIGGFAADWTRTGDVEVRLSEIIMQATRARVDGLVVDGKLRVEAPPSPAECISADCPGVVINDITVNVARGEGLGAAVDWGHTVVTNTTAYGGEFAEPGFASIAFFVGATDGATPLLAANTAPMNAYGGAGFSLRGSRAALRDNRVESGGTAIEISTDTLCESTAILVGNTLSAPNGIESFGARVWATHNVINSPAGTNDTVGIGVRGGELTAYNNILNVMGADERSKGVSCSDASGAVVNNTIVVGDAEKAAIGVSVSSSVGMVVANNVIAVGLADETSSVEIGGSVVDLRHNLLEVNPAVCLILVDGCVARLSQVSDCEWTGCAAAEGNESLPPGFVDRTSGNLHIADGSLAIDSGIDPSVFGLAIDDDIDGEPRPAGAGFDTGADEVP